MEPWYQFAALLFKPCVRLLLRPRFRGQERVPRRGGLIFAVNHVSHVDPIVVAVFVDSAGRRPRYLAKASLFKVPFFKWVLNGAKQIPVLRETADATNALGHAIAAIEAGECVVVYPEGTVTRDPDGWPMLAKTGIARLALATGAPVVPLGQWGCQDVFPYLGKRKLRLFRKVWVSAGDPVDLSAYTGKQPTSATLRAMTDDIMRAVTGIVGELRGATPPERPYDPRPLRGVDGERRTA